MAERKTVRAIKTGFWEGHRRRKGAEFTVDADCNEKWFVAVGAAPSGDSAPAQLMQAKGPQRRTFVGAMDAIAKTEAGEVEKLSVPVAEPAVNVGSEGADLT